MACDDWYQRRRQDAEGEFFRSVAEQGPRKGSGTKQGIYCLTAGGQLLAYKNSADPEVMFDVLQVALQRFQQLPQSETAPGAVTVPEFAADEMDQRYTRTPPENGLIVSVFTRVLERDEQGCFQACSGGESAYDGFGTAVDHLWITEAEWEALLPPAPVAGQSQPLPRGIAERILRFHLVDNTRGEPPFWQQTDIREQSITMTIEKVTPNEIRMRIAGSVLLATAADLAAAVRGYDASLHGELRIDRAAQKVTQFEITSVGNHWGEGTFTRGARPGRTPLAVVMQMANGDIPADRVPPQGIRNARDYMSVEGTAR